MEIKAQSKHAQAFMLETEPLLYPALMTQLYMKHDPNGPAKRKHITATLSLARVKSWKGLKGTPGKDVGKNTMKTP